MLNQANILSETAHVHPPVSASTPMELDRFVRKPVARVATTVPRRVSPKHLKCKTCQGKCCIGRCRF